jgi:hypothetical protein
MKTKLNIDGKYYEGELTEVQDEEITKKKKWRWMPEFEEIFFYRNEYGEVDNKGWISSDCDLHNLSIGNVFKTEEDCQAHLDYLQALEILKADAEYWEADWEGCDKYKWCVYYDFTQQMFNTSYTSKCKGADIYFKNNKLAEASLKNHRKEWLIVLGVKE